MMMVIIIFVGLFHWFGDTTNREGDGSSDDDGKGQPGEGAPRWAPAPVSGLLL